MNKAQGRLAAWLRGVPNALAIAFGLSAADAEYAGRIRAAQVSAIVRLTPTAVTASCLNSAILVIALAHAGELRPEHWVWLSLMLALAAKYGRTWFRGRRRESGRPASRRAIRKVILNGALFGVLWAIIPIVTFPHARHDIQLVIACLMAGMMCAGGFVLATVPLAGIIYVALVSAGAIWALVQDASPLYVALIALVFVYAAVVIINLSWNAFLFVNHRLSEEQIRAEVAARESAQEQTAHLERMRALGELAGGIAHDFNNILQVIGGSAELIERHPENIDATRHEARRIEDVVEHGSSISRRLLAFARRDILSPEPIDITSLIAEVRDLIALSLGSEIAIHIDCAASRLGVLADKRRLETALLNLALNARDAMPDGGSLTISARGEHVDAKSEMGHVEAGDYVRLSISDTGTGMESATLRRAAEPFFTTKPAGKGTGLGLSMVKGFAEQSGGAFAIASHPLRGTTVMIWLPQAAPAALVQTQVGEKTAARISDTDAKGRVLVAEDDPMVREVLAASLEDAGFSTFIAEDGLEALAYLDQGSEIDVLITDLSMPGMNGLDLIQAMHARVPDLPVILLTGYIGDATVAIGDDAVRQRLTWLQKPIRPGQLAEQVAAIIALRTDCTESASSVAG